MLVFVRAHCYRPRINGDIKKKTLNSTGKLSLGVGPAQTSRAGLGFLPRGLGSVHCVYVAEPGVWTFTASHLGAVTKIRHKLIPPVMQESRSLQR